MAYYILTRYITLIVLRLDKNCDDINASNDESKVDLGDTTVKELVDTDGG